MSPLPRNRPQRRHYLLTLVVLASLFSAGRLAQAQTPIEQSPTSSLHDARLSSYTARYKTSARGFTLYLDRELKTSGDNRYILTNAGKILVVGFHEISVFSISGGQVVSRSYVYQGNGLVNRKREVHFDNPSVARSLYKGSWYQLPYSPGTLDRMSQWEQVRLTLLAGPQPVNAITLQVADGKRVKNSTLVFVAEEELVTALGSIRALHFKRLHDNAERQSDLWFAPEWDYLMVKTIHVENGEPVEVSLVSASIDGMPISAR